MLQDGIVDHGPERGAMVTDRHLVIGLTGNLGAGKSTVGRIAGDLGARVIDSDQTVRDLLTKDSELASSIQGAFGTEVMLDGRPDRAALARIIFEDPGELARLERILYPRVGERTAEMLAKTTAAPATVIEAIKIVEGPNVDRLDALWLVVTPPEIQIQRATATGRISAAEARRRLAVQSSPDDKERLFMARRPGHPVWRIDNSTGIQDLQQRVAAVWRESLAYGDGPTR